MSIEDRVRNIVLPIVTDLDLVLFDLEYGGGRLRITIDHDQGVDSEVLTLATRQISRELDEIDPISSGYTLEVTTPGIERKLRRAEHYKRSINYQVSIKLVEELDGDRRVTGTITSADDDGVTIRRPDGSDLVLAYDRVQKAKTVFDWGPQPKPGGKAGNKTTGGTAGNKAASNKSSQKQSNQKKATGPTKKAGVS